MQAGNPQRWPVISPASLIENPNCRYNGEFAGTRVLRSYIFLFSHTTARLPLASIEKPVTSPLSLMVLQQGATAKKAPGSVGRSCLPVCLDHTHVRPVPSARTDPPTTSPRLLMLLATLITPPWLPRMSMAVPSASQRTACGPLT